MPTYYLDRFKFDDDGTFGRINDSNNNRLCYTCERTPNDDHPCIPVGTYTFTAYNSPTKGAVWITQDVPGRSDIEIHAGNTEDDSLGCILVGDSLGIVNGLNAVLNSKVTLEKLHTILPDTFDLVVSGE